MATILTVDDRPINRQFLVTLLGYGKHRVIEAQDGAEGLRLLYGEHPDLVILDVKMPLVDGFEFLGHLRDDISVADTPVILYTGLQLDEARRSELMSQGVTAFIMKPAEPQVILDAVNKALQGHTTEDDAALPSFTIDDLQCRLAAEQSIGMRLNALVETGLELSLEKDPARLLERFCNAACQILDAKYAVIGILDASAQELTNIFVSGCSHEGPITFSPPRTEAIDSIIKKGRPVRRRGAGDDQFVLLNPEQTPVECFLGVPIASGTKSYGWFYVINEKGSTAFEVEHERIAETLAAQIAVFYENILLYEEVRIKSIELEIESAERERAEKQRAQAAFELDRARQEQLELRDRFFSHVSHELRSPLSAIYQFTTIILDDLAGAITDEQREYLDIILRNSLQLRTMIDDLLEVTRAESGKQHIEPRDFGLAELCKELKTSFRKRAADLGVNLSSEGFDDLPEVFADPGRIRQVLNNLLDNAIKFTPVGGNVCILATVDPAEPGFVRIEVVDTGCGIAKQSLGSIFERHFQEERVTESSRSGLGLGLYICKQLIELQGGRIWAESNHGLGSSFFFTLPAANADARCTQLVSEKAQELTVV